MSSPDVQKPLSLSLKVSGGILGKTREISINGNQATWNVPHSRKDLPPTVPTAKELTSATIEELTHAITFLKEQNPKPEYVREGRTIRDGQSYVLQVHSPVEMAICASDRSGAPEAFYRLTSKIQTAAIPKKQIP